MKTFSTFPKYFLLVFLILSSCRTPEETVQPTPTPEVLQGPYQNPYFLTESQKYIYNISEVPEIKLDINVDEWNKLLSYYDQNPQNEEYVAGNFTWKNSAHTESLMNVGLRPVSYTHLDVYKRQTFYFALLLIFACLPPFYASALIGDRI